MSVALVFLSVGDEVTAEPEPRLGLHRRVNAALERASGWLLDRQESEGGWGTSDRVHPLGRTALCAYALRHAGFPRDHPAVEKALRTIGPRSTGNPIPVKSTYEAGCLALWLSGMGDAYRRNLHEICGWLCDRFDAGTGMWGYPEGAPDLSNTVFAVMALRIGEERGFKVPRRIWERVLSGLPVLQVEDGRFRYRQGTVARASMTHAGLLCLKFARDSLKAKQVSAKVGRALKKGHAWCDDNLDVKTASFGSGFHEGYYAYYMWGLARYCVLFDKPRLGNRDWYREGAEELLERQEGDGSWGAEDETAFCMLFLRKAALTEPSPQYPVSEGREGKRRDEPTPVSSGRSPSSDQPSKEPQRPFSEVPYLRSWLLAGPFQSQGAVDDMLDKTHFRVSRIVPLAGRSAGKKKWVRYDSDEDMIDFEKALSASDFSAYYAALWLTAESEIAVRFWLGTDDGVRVYLNGDLAGESRHHDYCGDDHILVEARLRAGRNSLLVKVSDVGYYCRLKMRITDVEGKVPAGVVVSTRR